MKIFNDVVEPNMNNAGVRFFFDNCTDVEKAVVDERVAFFNSNLGPDDKMTTPDNMFEILNHIHVSEWQATYHFYHVILHYLNSVAADQSLIDAVEAEIEDYVNQCFININGRKVGIDVELLNEGHFERYIPVMDMRYMSQYFIDLAPKFFGLDHSIDERNADNGKVLGDFLSNYDDEKVHEFVQWATRLVIEYDKKERAINRKYDHNNDGCVNISDEERKAMNQELNSIWDTLL